VNAFALEAAVDAVTDGMRNSKTRDEFIRWQKVLTQLVLLQPQSGREDDRA
jgi:hypothetical protein